MSDIKISLDTVGEENEITLVRVDGVIDTMTATDLEKVINSLLDQKRFGIIIDLAGVDYISSAGWGIFISNIREIRQQGGDIKLARMIPNVYEIFELLEFDSILKAFDDLEEAKAEFSLPANRSSSAIPKNSQLISGGDSRQDTSPLAASAVSVEDKAGTIGGAKQAQPQMALNFDEKIRDIIRKDPFLGISEIKRELHSESYSEKSIGWWGVLKWLYAHDLTSRKDRYHFSRKS
ncbi:MAG: hypothetical protein CO189_03885 [candidate division Zixibacteria bacterium CG_4_9_14_3_um_filter_46_8]|nr:MAG: hypothetical protein CO189_03885 [candidate division Zixibacteria bacterium CG_4_9_14_3_um_filter_46_8]